MSHVVSLCVATYPTRGLAEEDFRVIKNLDLGDEIRILSAAVVMKDESGRVGVVKDVHHPVVKGALIGGVLALVMPIGLIAEVAGVVGGAIIGKVAGHFHKGLSHGDIVELGTLLNADSVALIIMTEGPTATVLGEHLPAAQQVVHKTISTDEAGFNALVAHSDTEDWRAS